MLAGRSQLPVGFDGTKPKHSDWPSIAAIANAVSCPRSNVPPAVVLPEILIHREGRVIPGQFAGEMGEHRNPMFVNYSPFNADSYGAWPEYGFSHARSGEEPQGLCLSSTESVIAGQYGPRTIQRALGLLETIGRQQASLETAAENENFDRHRQKAVSLLANGQTQKAFSIADADPKQLDRYGRNTFGWSLLMARQLVEAGVNMVQVNLGNDETWDTHTNAFPVLKNFLFPPTDRAVSALLDDLADRGLLDSTLVVMAGEMGRTPKISTLAQFPGKPGRDHWGTQTVFFAGGGVRGGTVIGSTDKIGEYPAANPQRPENMAATIYEALGIPHRRLARCE